MANNIAPLTEGNIYEWICSTGYLVPTTERELARFEKLHPSEGIIVNAEAIDPMSIINGTRKENKLSVSSLLIPWNEEQELRMAARKHGGLPPEIEEQIRKNQKKRDNGGD